MGSNSHGGFVPKGLVAIGEGNAAEAAEEGLGEGRAAPLGAGAWSDGIEEVGAGDAVPPEQPATTTTMASNARFIGGSLASSTDPSFRGPLIASP